jgi:hypothetical protein
VKEAGPAPSTGLDHEAADDGIAVHVAQLFDALVFVMDVEVVIASLPERPLRAAQGNGKFQRMDDIGDCASVWFADEEMNMFGHDDIPGDYEVITAPYSFKGIYKNVASRGRPQVLPTVETAECEEMEISGVMEAD